MTEPAAFDAEATPAVTLAGKVWPIPELVWRDLRKCRKELLELTDLINVAIAASPGHEGEGDQARAVRHMTAMELAIGELSNEDFERLVMGPLLAGLQAAHPSFTRDELWGMRLTETERQVAWIVVRRQSGLFAAKADEETVPGEAGGAAQSPT